MSSSGDNASRQIEAFLEMLVAERGAASLTIDAAKARLHRDHALEPVHHLRVVTSNHGILHLDFLFVDGCGWLENEPAR